MNPADSVKRAALNAAIDYLLADPEKNLPKAMEAVGKYGQVRPQHPWVIPLDPTSACNLHCPGC